MACLIFTAKTPEPGEIFCHQPDNISIENSTSLWIKAAHVKQFSIIEDEESYDLCTTYNNSVDRFLSRNFRDNGTLESCTRFEHVIENNYFSLIHQFDTFCNRDWLVPLTQSFHLLGVLIGGIVANHLLKMISPRETMLIGMISQIFFGIATGYAPTYLLHILFRAAVAGTCSLQCIGIMILSDITLGKYRATVVSQFEQFWALGLILLPFVGGWWSSWALVYVAITLPTFILMFLYPFIPDSPRWLIKHERVDDALNVLLDAAKINGKNDISKEQLRHKLEMMSIESKKEPLEPSWWNLWDGNFAFKRKLIVAHLGWSIYLMLHFAYLLHVRDMGRNYLQINTVMIGVCEVIGTLIALYLILYTTKKWMWMSLLNIVTSFVACSAVFVPYTVPSMYRIVIYMITVVIAKATVSTSLAVFITCNPEIVTKDKKRLCNYSAMTCSRTLVMISPFIDYFAKYGQLIPQYIMAVMNITISLLIMTCIDTPRTVPMQKQNNEVQIYQIPVTNTAGSNAESTQQ
ncbi:hypothetical protein ACKWTF_010401 [Chironomus riparius]